MSRPTSALTMYDFVKQIAQVAGIAYYGPSGDQRALPPTDDYELSICCDIFNDGVRDFIANPPRNGWRWKRRMASVTFSIEAITGVVDSADTTTLVDLTLATSYGDDDELNGYWVYCTSGTGEGSYAQITDYTGATGTVTVAEWLTETGLTGGTTPAATDEFSITSVETVNGDTSRYPLPEDFTGAVLGPICYKSGTNLASPISWDSEATLRDLRARTSESSSGYPTQAATRPLEPKTNAPGITRRWELLVYPRPSSEDTVQFPYSKEFDNMLLEMGVADSGSSTTLVDAERYELDDYFNGWTLEVVAGTGRSEMATVTDFTQSTGTITFAALSGGSTPDDTSVYSLMPANNLHPAGQRFDNVMRAACLAQTEQQITDVEGGYNSKYYKIDLPSAYELDGNTAPRTVGNLNGRRPRRGRSWTNVEYND